MAGGFYGGAVPSQFSPRTSTENGTLGGRPSALDELPDDQDWDATSCASSGSSPRFGTGSPRARGSEAPVDVAAIRAHFTAALHADRELMKYVRQDTDRIQAQLRELLDIRMQLEQEVRESANESRRLVRARDGLQQQVHEAKRQLGSFCAERMAVRRACYLSTRGSQGSSAELALLQQTLREEQDLLEECNHANEYLKQACRHLDEDMAELERRRHTVFDQALTERSQAEMEQRQRAGMRQDLDRMRVQRLPSEEMPEIAGAGTIDYPGKEMAISHGAGRWPISKQPEPHSWASTLVGGGMS